MHIEKYECGYFAIWITKEEKNDKSVLETIEKYKLQGKTAVFCSGKKSLNDILTELVRNNA